jgi:hypothetical protein
VQPSPPDGHHFYTLARLVRPRGISQINSGMVSDTRNRNITVTDIERRLQTIEELVMVPKFASPPGEFSPKVGGAGATVTLYGKNFNVGTVKVRFDTVYATIAGTPSLTEISATVPPGVSGAVKISVETDGGTATSVDSFTVIGGGGTGDPPAFAAPPGEFSPKVGSIGASVTLFGTHFNEPGLTVKFGAVNAVVNSSNATQISTSVPSGASGSLKITVTTNHGSDISSDSFTVL